MATETLAFSEVKQAAVMGWCLKDSGFWLKFKALGRPEWFANPYVAKLYSAMADFSNRHHRPPTADELGQDQAWSREDARTQARIREVLGECLAATDSVGLDVIRAELTAWLKAVGFYQAFMKGQDLYNRHQVDEAIAVVDEALLRARVSSFDTGINPGFVESSTRILQEAEVREAQGPLVLRYGIEYLDHLTRGICPNELVLVGAPPGRGKTQLISGISLSSSQAGYPTYVFALEAEDHEIERRIKWGMIAGHYYKTQDSPKFISYPDWRNSTHPSEVAAQIRDIEKKIEPQFVAAVRNLHTFYRTSGDFDVQDLERAVLQVVGKARLIIIDHLHYVDVDGDDNENRAYKRVMKTVRDIVLRYGVPIILVAHLRKHTGGKDPGLIADMDDFMGTSDITKIATTAILVAPARGEIEGTDGPIPRRPGISPTFMQVGKFRPDGSRTWYTGLLEYDIKTGSYARGYRIGQMTWGNKTWVECEPEEVPGWAFPSGRIVGRGLH